MDTTGERDLDVIKAKIKKLLALSKSPNEYEATSALEKATALMSAYKLSETDCVLFVETPAKATKRFCKWRSTLSQAVAWLYQCYVYRDVDTGTYNFCGSEFDAFMAAGMYSYLSGSVERIAKQNIRKNAKTKFRESYKLGITQNITERIYKMSDQCSWAPERAHRINTVAQYIEGVHVITNKKRSDCKTNTSALYRGYAAGTNINLNRQTTGFGERMIEY